MTLRTIPITLDGEVVDALEKIAKREISSRNRIMKIAILNFIKEDGKKTKSKK